MNHSSQVSEIKVKTSNLNWPWCQSVSWDSTVQVLKSVAGTNNNVHLHVYVYIVNVGTLIGLMHYLYSRGFLPFSHINSHY